MIYSQATMDNSKRMTQKYVKLKYGALVCTLILFIRIAWLWSSPGYDTLALRSSKNANRKDNSARVCLPASNDIALSATGSSEIGSALQRGAKTCTSVGSAEPIAWGPVAWNLLHTMAANFSDKPDMAHIDHCKTFFVSLPYMLPCGDCGYHLKEYLKDIDLDLACSSRIRLRSFIVKIAHLGKRQWTVEEAIENYATTKICIHNDTTWNSDISL